MALPFVPSSQVKAGCYCRISSDPNDRREGVDRQRDDTTTLCEVKGWTPVEFYIDNDRSASSGKQRPEWDRLLADIKAGKIDAIAAWDQDRGWRMMSELETLRTFFNTLGRTVYLATTGQGDIDLYSPTGVLTAQIKTAVSEHEIAMMKVRQRRAARQRAEQGRPKWRKAFGYLDAGGDLREPDPQIAPLVQQGYAAILAGSSLKDVCKMWNGAGAYTLNGNEWNESLVSQFLRKARNAGLRSHNGEIVGAGTWEGLVDESTWRATQAVLNTPGRAPGRKSVRQHLLTGVLQCGKPGCGGYLAGRWAMQQQRSGPRAHSITYGCKQCHGVSVRAEHIEPLLINDLLIPRLTRPDAENLLTNEALGETEAEDIRREVQTLRSELTQIGIERGQRLLTGEQAKVATDLINADIDNLEQRLRSQQVAWLFEDIPLGTSEAGAAVLGLSADRLRAIIRVLMTVTVRPVGKGGHVFNPERVAVQWHGTEQVREISEQLVSTV